MRRKSKRNRHHPVLFTICILALIASVGFIQLHPSPVAVEESNLILVNKQYRLPEDYVPSDLVKVGINFPDSTPSERRQMRAEAALALEQMEAAMKEEGLALIGVSGYRSFSTQQSLYRRRLSEAGAAHVSQYNAEAGASEHQTGLAMDVAAEGKSVLTEAFADTDEYKWLQSNAHHYGFIIRYPEGMEDETGYLFEPWHLRYVGDAAADIFKSRLTMEAYMRLHYPSLDFVRGRNAPN